MFVQESTPHLSQPFVNFEQKVSTKPLFVWNGMGRLNILSQAMKAGINKWNNILCSSEPNLRRNPPGPFTTAFC